MLKKTVIRWQGTKELTQDETKYLKKINFEVKFRRLMCKNALIIYRKPTKPFISIRSYLIFYFCSAECVWL